MSSEGLLLCKAIQGDFQRICMGPGSYSRFSFQPEEIGQELMGTCGETGDSEARKQRRFKGKRPRAWLCKEQGPGPEHQSARRERLALLRPSFQSFSATTSKARATWGGQRQHAQPSEGLAWTTGSSPPAVLSFQAAAHGEEASCEHAHSSTQAREGETDRWQRPETIFYYEF